MGWKMEFRNSLQRLRDNVATNDNLRRNEIYHLRERMTIAEGKLWALTNGLEVTENNVVTFDSEEQIRSCPFVHDFGDENFDKFKVIEPFTIILYDVVYPSGSTIEV